MPTTTETLYLEWLAAERALSASEEDIEGPLNDEANRLADALLASSIKTERDALCILAYQCATMGATWPDPSDPKTTAPGSVLAAFRAISFPVRTW